MRSRPSLLALALASFAALPAQDPLPTDGVPFLRNPDLWKTPFQSDSDAEGRPSTTAAWASGDTYKVRVGTDGMHFVPVLGEGFDRGLPFDWRTSSITRGAHAMVAPGDTARLEHGGQRATLVHGDGAVLEVYDAIDAGVEQTFVLRSRPEGTGDLVVTGALQTELLAAPRTARHAGLDFHAPADQAAAAGIGDQPVIRYGEAFAIDARGVQVPLASGFDGASITLEVPGDWLDRAAYPVTIDPLTSRVLFPASGAATNGQVSYPQIIRDDVRGRLIVAYGRPTVGSTDHDTYLRYFDDAFQGNGLFYSDVSDQRDTRYHALASNRREDRIVLAIGSYEAQVSRIRLYSHDAGSLAAGNGNLVLVPSTAVNQQQLHPALGGDVGGASSWVVLAYEAEIGTGQPSTDATRVLVRRIHATDLTMLAAHDPNFGTANYDAQNASVSDQTDAGGWVVAWQQRSTAQNTRWAIELERVGPDGLATGRVGFALGGGNRHSQTPKIAGGDDRYLLVGATQTAISDLPSAFGDQLVAARFDWSNGAPFPTMKNVETFASSNSNLLTLGLRARPIAFDHRTDSHWGVAWREADIGRLRVARFGYEGRLVEPGVLAVNSNGVNHLSPSVAYDRDAMRFAIAWATTDAAGHYPMAGRHLTYPHTAANVAYAGGCAGALSTFGRGTSLPHAGSEFFGLRLGGAVPATPSFLFASIALGNTPLPGSPNCALLLTDNLPLIDVAVGVTGNQGHWDVPMPLPAVGVGVNVFWQVIQIDGATLKSSDAVETRIR